MRNFEEERMANYLDGKKKMETQVEVKKAKGNPEEIMCAQFAEQLTALESYNQVPNLIFWSHMDSGQRSGGHALAKAICAVIPNGFKYIKAVFGKINQYAAIAGGRAKRMGAKKGIPDYMFHFHNNGIVTTGYIEFKTEKNTLTPAQKDFKAMCEKVGFHWALARSVDDGLATLKRWGILNGGVQ